ncbi:MAG: M60 family metallopeptidase [Myxococcota bacterium]
MDKDVAVVQVNEWGTLHLGNEHVDALRQFVMEGGGLVIAGSALHWSWWLADGGPFPGDAVLSGTGLSWERTSVRDMRGSNASFDASSVADLLWCNYVLGREVDDPSLARVGPLFEAARAFGREEEVQAALTRLLDETPALPVARDNPQARLAAHVPALLGPVSWPGPHPWASVFPGSATREPAPGEHSVVIRTAFKRDQPLGWYAAAGDVVTVSVDPSVVNTGLTIRVGELYDDNRNLDHINVWRRAPLLYREFPVDATSVEVGNAFGGSIYLVVPDGTPDHTITLTVSGAVQQAFYSLEEGDVGRWTVHPVDSGAPQAIVQQPTKIRMVVATDTATQLADPRETLLFWEGFYDHHAYLSQEPVSRNYASHWIFDPQVGWGYANATPARITYPLLSEGWAMRTQLGNEDWWLFGHELGHQFQTPDWSGGDITEVAVNLWTMYTLNTYLYGGGNFETRGHRGNTIDHNALMGARWATADLFGKLELYRQLVFEFGWDAYIQTFATYHDPAFPREEFGGFMDGFAHRFSAVVQRDITPFLLHWEYPVSPEAVNAIRARGYEPWLPPGW